LSSLILIRIFSQFFRFFNFERDESSKKLSLLNDPRKNPEPFSEKEAGANLSQNNLSGRAFDFRASPDLDTLIHLRMRSRKGRKIRTRKTILMEILEACRSPAVEHWIMIRARVGYQSFVKYIDKLLSEGKITSSRAGEENGRRSKTYYTLTREGLQMLEELKSEQGKK
jgi:predicted transcriptional regulator